MARAYAGAWHQRLPEGGSWGGGGRPWSIRSRAAPVMGSRHGRMGAGASALAEVGTAWRSRLAGPVGVQAEAAGQLAAACSWQQRLEGIGGREAAA
jgi:hypothetical protein